MSIYDDLDPVVKDLLQEFKQGVITVREEHTPQRPADLPSWQDWKPVTEIRVYELDAVARAAGPGNAGKSLANGDTVRIDDYLITCSDRMWLSSVNGVPVTRVESPFNAELLQSLTIDGLAGTLLTMTPVPGAGKKLVHKFIFRR